MRGGNVGRFSWYEMKMRILCGAWGELAAEAASPVGWLGGEFGGGFWTRDDKIKGRASGSGDRGRRFV